MMSTQLDREAFSRLPIIEQAVELDKQSPLAAYRTWFKAPASQRTALLKQTLEEAAEIDTDVHRLIGRYSKATPVQKFVLGNFEILSSEAAAKIITPTNGNPPTDDEINRDYRNQKAAYFRYLDYLDELDDKTGIRVEKEETDTHAPNSFPMRRFSIPEMAELVRNLQDIVPESSELFRFMSLTHPIRHMDLLLEPDIRNLIEGSFDLTHQTMMNILSQNEFPSLGVFKIAFEKRPELYKPAEMWSIEGVERPTGSFLFAMLRRPNIMHRREPNAVGRRLFDEDPNKIDRMQEKVIDYLLDEEFMQRVAPYFTSPQYFNDVLIQPNAGGLLLLKGDELEDEEAVAKKRQLFREVLQKAEIYLKEKNDLDKVAALRGHQTGGLNYKDYLIT